MRHRNACREIGFAITSFARPSPSVPRIIAILSMPARAGSSIETESSDKARAMVLNPNSFKDSMGL